MKEKWLARFKHNILDHWHVISSKLRRAIKGWSLNLESHQKSVKRDILRRILILDERGDCRDLSQNEWEERYALDRQLQQMLNDEEIKWQRRGGEMWILAGDSNSSYFHKCANGRRRKMNIAMLEASGQELVDHQELKLHITNYYKSLFGSEKTADMHLDTDLWDANHQINQHENELLTKPFSLEELDAAMKEMKNNTAPGPDGFSVEFFKAF